MLRGDLIDDGWQGRRHISNKDVSSQGISDFSLLEKAFRRLSDYRRVALEPLSHAIMASWPVRGATELTVDVIPQVDWLSGGRKRAERESESFGC